MKSPSNTSPPPKKKPINQKMGDQYGDLKEYNMTKHNVISWYDLKVFNVKKKKKEREKKKEKRH